MKYSLHFIALLSQSQHLAPDPGSFHVRLWMSLPTLCLQSRLIPCQAVSLPTPYHIIWDPSSSRVRFGCHCPLHVSKPGSSRVSLWMSSCLQSWLIPCQAVSLPSLCLQTQLIPCQAVDVIAHSMSPNPAHPMSGCVTAHPTSPMPAHPVSVCVIAHPVSLLPPGQMGTQDANTELCSRLTRTLCFPARISPDLAICAFSPQSQALSWAAFPAPSAPGPRRRLSPSAPL